MVLSSVLNFIQRHVEKKTNKDIVIRQSKFFSKEALKDAIDICKTVLDKDINQSRRGSHPASAFYGDIYEVMSERFANEVPTPRFAILDPADVPTIPEDVSTIVASRLNDCKAMLSFLVEKHEASAAPSSENQPPIWPSLPRPERTIPVVLSNLPASLSANPTKQKEFLRKIGPADKIDRIEQRRDRLFVHMKDETSASVVASGAQGEQNIRSKVLRSEYLGIIYVDKDYDVSTIPNLISGVSQAKRFGNSSVVQLTFVTKIDFDQALKFGIKVEYTMFSVSKPLTKPLQCYKCQGFGHRANQCQKDTKCSKCAGDHSYSECTSDVLKCANCGSNHASNSFRCPNLKNAARGTIPDQAAPKNLNRKPAR